MHVLLPSMEAVPAILVVDTPPMDVGLALDMVGTLEIHIFGSGGRTGNRRTDESLHCRTCILEVLLIGSPY